MGGERTTQTDDPQKGCQHFLRAQGWIDPSAWVRWEIHAAQEGSGSEGRSTRIVSALRTCPWQTHRLEGLAEATSWGFESAFRISFQQVSFLEPRLLRQGLRLVVTIKWSQVLVEPIFSELVFLFLFLLSPEGRTKDFTRVVCKEMYLIVIPE